MPEWSPFSHMLSVTTPVNVCLPGAATNATASRPRSSGFTFFLGARNHDVRGGGAGIHDPRACLARFIGYPKRLRGGARYGDGRVRTSMFLVGSHKVDERRPELGLHPGPVLLGGVERGLNRRLIALGFELQILSNAVQIALAGAFYC